MGNHVWNELSGETWNVRIGPNYAKNKKKAPSLASLCHLQGVCLSREAVERDWVVFPDVHT